MTVVATNEVVAIPIGEVVPHPGNARKGNIPAIQKSLERFGQMKPIVVQQNTMYVVAGNHTLAAAQKLGWSTIDAIILDIDDNTAFAYLIADNRTSDKAKYDNKKQLLSLRQMDFEDLEGTGYDLDEIEELENELGVNANGSEDTGEVTFVPVPQKEGEVVEKREPLRDIVMLMPQSEAQVFGAQVAQLQKAWGTSKVVETVQRAVSEAVEQL